MLTGSNLLDKVKELGDVYKSDLVSSCGYVSTKKGGGDRLNFTAFYEALLEAKGLNLGNDGVGRGKGGRKLNYTATVQGNGNLLIGKAIATLCLFLLPAGMPNAAEAQLGGTFSGLNEFAKKVVIGIETPFAAGSGVIIGRSGREGAWKYYFLTAKHVADGNPENEEFLIFSKSGNNTSRERVTAFIHPPEFKEMDLAVGTFESSTYYQVSPIFALGKRQTYRAARWYNGKTFNDAEKIQGDPIVAGISVPSGSITVPIFRISPASIQDRAPGNKDGYEMLYISPSTVPGMSGGGLFGARLCPNWTWTPKNGEAQSISGAYGGLLAIHGRSEGYGQSGSRSGTSLGIPMDLVKRFLENAEYIPNGENYDYLVVESCIENNVQ